MRVTAVEDWVTEPLERFVRDARTRFAVMLHPSGQVLAQYGFTRAVDVAAACALAAAIHASAGELGRLVDGQPFGTLHHAGRERELFLGAAQTARGPYILFTVFDQESSLGLVRLYFGELSRDLSAAAPSTVEPDEPVLAVDFERELNRNLATLFGRA